MRTELVSARLAGFPRGRLFGLLAEGAKYSAIDLAVGTPAAPDTPPELIEAACRALRDGTNQYGLPHGDPRLRESIASHVGADPDTEITVTAGATEALAVAMLTLVDPGDEVILLDPGYENFLSAVAMAGAVPRHVPVTGPHWRADPAALAAAFGPRTRAILINSPGNPTGHVMSEEELLEIAELCERWNVAVIADEVYADFVFDGNVHLSAAGTPELAERTVVIRSLSKSHAVSGWRLGYLKAPARLTSALREMHVAVAGMAATPLQQAVATAAAAPGFWAPRDDLSVQRRLAVSALQEMGAHCQAPEGGCYVLADIGPLTPEDGERFAFRTAREAGVLLTPGQYFFSGAGEKGDHLVRLAFNRPVSTMEEARRRLAAYTP
ncbi:pyridoxal phosphate-dependent aminotransferase [Streptomyces sp. NPDC006197]|uniref:pyridoxal phosphate-dependent aminotransferase n=1 Tax=Streptomyces sp. NPDC006197 TaxID=3156685 RepID=UPI0033AED65E